MNTWQPYARLTIPLTPDPDYLATQEFPAERVLPYHRTLPGNSSVKTAEVMLLILAYGANGAKIAAQSGTIDVRKLEVVPSDVGTQVVEVSAAAAFDAGVPVPSGLADFGQGAYLLQISAVAGLPVGTESIGVYFKYV